MLRRAIDLKSIADIMSIIDYRKKRLDKNQARKLISLIVTQFPQNIFFSRHALVEIKKDDLTTSDILNVIKSGHAQIHSDAELENGSYRYRLETQNIMVVLAFSSSESMIVVTAWRKKI